MKPIKISIKQLPHGEGMDIPAYATPQSSGLDLRAAIGQPISLPSLGRAIIPTGIEITDFPEGYEAQVRARSGLAAKKGLTVANGVGTIDADYRKEIGVILINLSDSPVVIRRGDRIAQLVIAPVVQAELVEDGKTTATDRQGGFGSTGVE